MRVAIEDGSHLAGHAHHGEAVRAIRSNLAVQHGVRRAAILGERHAHRRVRGQNHDAGMITRKTKLARRAVHAVAHHTAQLALLDLDATGELRPHQRGHDVIALFEVLGAAHNLQRLGRAVFPQVIVPHIDHRDPHVVGIRMGLFRHDLRRHDMVERFAHGVDGLNLSARTDEFAAELFRRLRNVDELLQPVI